MVDITPEKIETYSSEDFESAAQRLLGKRYQILKELNATPAQICTAFNDEFFSGEMPKNDANHNDINLMLNVSVDIYLGPGHPRFTDSQSEQTPVLSLSLVDLMTSDIPPDFSDDL
jgi:hypothetical protein